MTQIKNLLIEEISYEQEFNALGIFKRGSDLALLDNPGYKGEFSDHYVLPG